MSAHILLIWPTASGAGKQGLVRDFAHVVLEARWPPITSLLLRRLACLADGHNWPRISREEGERSGFCDGFRTTADRDSATGTGAVVRKRRLGD